VLTADQLLKEGETFIEDYNIEIARWTNTHWTSTVPPLYAILTDHRIILQPHTRKRYDPAIIPTSYVTNVVRLNTDRNGIMLYLKTGHRIGMFVTADPQDTLLHNLQRRKAPKRQVHFDGEFDAATVRRIIEYLAS
jgi:hypothetical protein